MVTIVSDVYAALPVDVHVRQLPIIQGRTVETVNFVAAGIVIWCFPDVVGTSEWHLGVHFHQAFDAWWKCTPRCHSCMSCRYSYLLGGFNLCWPDTHTFNPGVSFGECPTCKLVGVRNYLSCLSSNVGHLLYCSTNPVTRAFVVANLQPYIWPGYSEHLLINSHHCNHTIFLYWLEG